MKKIIFILAVSFLMADAGNAQNFTVSGPGAPANQQAPVQAPPPLNPREAYNQAKADGAIFGVSQPLASAEAVASSGGQEPNVAIKVLSEFRAGDVPAFSYIISNKSSSSMIVSFIADIRCQKIPRNFLVLSRQTLAPKGVYTGVFTDHQLPADIESQSCTAVVSIIQPKYSEVKKDFKLIGKAALKLGMDLSGNASCPALSTAFLANASCRTDRRQLFTVGSPIYANPLANIADWKKISYQAVLIDPDGSRLPVVLPYFFIPDRLGVWSIEVTADLSGYLPASKTFSFAVIDALPRIQQTSLKTINSRMTGFTNDPQHLPPGNLSR